MARDIVKVRKVGESLVITLTQPVVADVELKEGDRVLIESAPPRRIVVSKEEANMPSTRRTELELEVLQSKHHALGSQIEYVIAQNNLNMPCEPGMDDSSIVELSLRQLNFQRASIATEIAEKRLVLFDQQGS